MDAARDDTRCHRQKAVHTAQYITAHYASGGTLLYDVRESCMCWTSPHGWRRPRHPRRSLASLLRHVASLSLLILKILLIPHSRNYCTPHHCTPYHTIPYHTIPYHTIPRSVLPGIIEISSRRNNGSRTTVSYSTTVVFCFS